MRFKLVFVVLVVCGLLGGTLWPRAARAELYTPEEVVDATVPVVDAYWSEVFAMSGLSYASPNEIWWYNTPDAPGAAMTYGCGEATLNNAFYCPPDQSIYLDYGFFSDIIDGYGDFAVALVVAHEWAHHIEHLVGIYRTQDGVADQWGEFFSIQTELLADCWSGVAGSYMDDLGMLEAGDLEEGYEVVLDLGDKHLGGEYSPLSGTAHGTSDQRLTAFFGGFEAADPGACPGIVDGILS